MLRWIVGGLYSVTALRGNDQERATVYTKLNTGENNTLKLHFTNDGGLKKIESDSALDFLFCAQLSWDGAQIFFFGTARSSPGTARTTRTARHARRPGGCAPSGRAARRPGGLFLAPSRPKKNSSRRPRKNLFVMGAPAGREEEERSLINRS